MRKLIYCLFALCLMATLNINAQEFSSTKNSSVEVGSAVTFGRMYEACSLGVAKVLYYNDGTYALVFGTDNRFDDPMFFKFETKEDLVNTLNTFSNIIENSEKGEFLFPNATKAYVFTGSINGFWKAVFVNVKGYAGNGYLPKPAIKKLLDKIGKFKES